MSSLADFSGPCSRKPACKNYAKCALKDDGKEECICPTLSNCPKEIKPVCGQDGVTYINDCFRKVASCKRKKLVQLAHPGACGMYCGIYFMKKRINVNLSSSNALKFILGSRSCAFYVTRSK
jgi:hypothetical protein